MVSFRGQKMLRPRPSVSFRGLISSWFNSKFPTSTPTPFICGVPPGVLGIWSHSEIACG